jgi:hypothetical protein
MPAPLEPYASVMDVLPLEANLTVLSSRSPENEFNRLKSSLSGRRPDLITAKLSNEFVNLAGVGAVESSQLTLAVKATHMMTQPLNLY